MALIPILLMITKINKNLCMNNFKNRLQNIRNLETSDESYTESEESFDESIESSEISFEDTSESMSSSEGNETTTETTEKRTEAPNDDNNTGLIAEDTYDAGITPGNNATSNEEENDKEFAVLYAIDNYHYSYQSQTISFYIYIFFHGYDFGHSLDFVPNIKISILIIYYNLRLLSETNEIKEIICSKNNSHGELYRYSCEQKVNGNISRIEGISIESENGQYMIDNTTSSLAEFKDITNQIIDRVKIEKGFVYIKNCVLLNREPVIQIKGETEDVQNNVNLVLDVKNYDGFVKVDSNLFLIKRLLRTLEGEKDVLVQLNPLKPLSADLNKTAGVLDDGANALIHFKKGTVSTVYYPLDYNNYFKTKNTKGLSGGAIAAIIITIAAVLIAIIAIAFIMMKKPVLPPNRMSGSVEAGYEMSSSTNAIN